MDSDFDQTLTVCIQYLLHSRNRFQGGGGVKKSGHHQVAHRLDDRTAFQCNCFFQNLEVFTYRSESGRIANLTISTGRVAQVGEHQRH